MEKVKQQLQILQDKFDSPDSRESINHRIVQMAISKRVGAVKKQRIYLSILLHLVIVTAFVVALYVLKHSGRQLLIQDINMSTIVLIFGFYYLFNLIQKVLLFFKLSKS